MKCFCTCFFVCLLSLYASAQLSDKIVIGTIDSIYSKILNEPRKIWVHVPNSDGSITNSKQRYPVVYLMDGDAHFYSVVGLIYHLSTVSGNTLCPQMIVVGIPNTDRFRDLTPSRPSGVAENAEEVKNMGGGEQFTAFMEKELIPYIDSTYPTQPYRMLIGHSLGGLMVMNTLTKHTNLFKSYIAIDPSMSWNDKDLLQTQKALATQTFEGRSLFLGIANTMADPKMDTTKVKKDTSAFSKHIRAILKTSQYLSNNKQNKLAFKYKYYKDDDHGSVPLIAEYDALHFIFDFYPMKMSYEEMQQVKMADIQKIENHYDNVSKRLGYKMSIPESMCNMLGYMTMGAGRMQEAAHLFQLNVTNYPNSFNVYDSIGDYYDKVGDKQKAIENYKQALTIQDHPETQMKLDKLLGK